MKKTFIITLILIIFSVAVAQELDNNIIQINYEKKSLAKAMLLSSLFPGAGQFYANRKSITTYIFPLIEIGLIAGYFINYNEGLDKEAAYEDYADDNYNRVNQYDVEVIVSDLHNDDIYTYDHFRLDAKNTQHFYEDIGKYDKYIFGWNDWYGDYVATGYDDDYLEGWIIESNRESDLRNNYIVMRKDAETSYDNAKSLSFGIVANHILAAIDAVRITKIYNRGYLSNTSKLEINFAPIFVNNNFSPALMVTKRF